MQSGYILENNTSRIPSQNDINNIRSAIVNNTDVLPLLDQKDYSLGQLYEFVEFANTRGFFTVSEAIKTKISFTVLWAAVKSGDTRTLQASINSFTNPNDIFQADAAGLTILHKSIQLGLLDSVKCLFITLREECHNNTVDDIKIADLIILAGKHNHIQIACYLVENCRNAAELKKIDKHLLQNAQNESFYREIKAKIDAELTAYQEIKKAIEATRYNDFHSVKTYLDTHGCAHLNKVDKHGYSILPEAGLCGRADIINLILAYDSKNIITEKNYQLALFSAAKYGYVAIVLTLLPKINTIHLLYITQKNIREIQNFSYEQGLRREDGNHAIVSERISATDVFEPIPQEAEAIKKTYPEILSYIQARQNALSNSMFSLLDFLIAIKRENLDIIKKYIAQLTNLKKFTTAELAIRIGLFTSIILFQQKIASTDVSAAITCYFIENTKNYDDIRTVYLKFTPAQREEFPLAKILAEKLILLNPTILPSTLKSYEDRIQVLKAEDYEVDVPSEYICSISYEIIEQPISVGIECTHAVLYDLFILVRSFVCKDTVPEYINAATNRVFIHVNELMNGISINTKNLIDKFVNEHEGIHAFNKLKAQAEAEAKAHNQSIGNKRNREREVRVKLFSQNKKPANESKATTASNPSP